MFRKFLTALMFVFIAASLFSSCAFCEELKIERVTVSSVENNRPELRGENAVDDNIHTRWASERSDPQWICFDLGSPKMFDSVNILWEAAYAGVYEIQISDDLKYWKTIYIEKEGDGDTDIIYVGKQKARYVRMYGIERAAGWGYSIFEFKIEIAKLDDGLIPSAPAGLSGVFADKIVFLNWKNNSESDFHFYNIYRSSKKDTGFIKLNSEPVKESKYKDETVTGGIEYYYYVRAVDFAGNESPGSEKIHGVPVSLSGRNFFKAPQCAWKRYLGDMPDRCISTSPDRGVALGGFGAGSFMYTINGSFGPFQTFDSTLYKGVWLPEAAFHIFEKAGNKKPQTKCLAAGRHLKKAWDKIRTGNGIYYGLQPKGWVSYNCFETDISQKFFSPIIPHNYQETSYPVGIWQFKFYNSTDENIEIGVMLTFPGVYVAENIRERQFKNSPLRQKDIIGVVMRSKKGIGEWCIASKALDRGSVSYTTSWDGDGNGADIWGQFKNGGVLNNGNLDDSHKAAAIAVNFKLKPGEERIVPFVISWDFPVVRFNSGTEWWKKYTQYFGRGGDNSAAIAKETLNNYGKWEKEIDDWMRPVINNKKYPDWLKCAAFNELYYNQIGGCFYEAGLKSGHDREFMGLHEDDHKHYVMESPVYTSADTLDVRHYSSIVFAKFWPEIERDTLRCYADGTLYFQFKKPVPKGLVPHDVGDPKKCDPYFKFDVYRHDIPDLVYWKDLSPKFVQQCWRYYYLYKDREFLDYVWPACKAVYSFMKSTDKNKDYLPDNSGSDNTYDAWGLYGTSLLCGGLWVGALECFEQMAIVKEDPILPEVRKWLKNAKKNLDAQLWMPGKGYYKIDTEGKFPTAIMSDGLNGQLYCGKYALADILPGERMKAHLLQTFERCVKPMKDYTGDGIGDIGAINAIKEDGTLIGTLQSDEVWTGSTYFLAALMYDAGLKKEALQTAYGVYFNTYENPRTAFWFNTPESWRVPTMKARPSGPEQYQRPRAVWELLLEINDPFLARPLSKSKN
ncbi:MAG: GH116 family glycosyl hydrolase [Candidatus Auribacterota bacterium]|nr:GH116 family glycosyl hydrolase [Candidatus Auribacterota bacterium]